LLQLGYFTLAPTAAGSVSNLTGRFRLERDRPLRPLFPSHPVVRMNTHDVPGACGASGYVTARRLRISPHSVTLGARPDCRESAGGPAACVGSLSKARRLPVGLLPNGRALQSINQSIKGLDSSAAEGRTSRRVLWAINAVGDQCCERSVLRAISAVGDQKPNMPPMPVA